MEGRAIVNLMAAAFESESSATGKATNLNSNGWVQAREGNTRWRNFEKYMVTVALDTWDGNLDPMHIPYWNTLNDTEEARPCGVRPCEPAPCNAIPCSPTPDNPFPPVPDDMSSDVLFFIPGPYHVVTFDTPHKVMHFPLSRVVHGLKMSFEIDIVGCSPDNFNGKDSVCNYIWLYVKEWLETFGYLNTKDFQNFRYSSKWGTPGDDSKKNDKATIQINDTKKHRPNLSPGRYEVTIFFDANGSSAEIGNDSGTIASVMVKTPFGKPVNLSSFDAQFGNHGNDRGAEAVWMDGTTYYNLMIEEYKGEQKTF